MSAANDDRASRFPWPVPIGAREAPVWTGAGFRVEGHVEPVPSYVATRSGWSDDLTEIHEADAGADHPIDLASRARALREVARGVLRGDEVVVEAGCSSGYMLADLRRAFPRALVIGTDYVPGPLRRLAQAQPDLPLLHMDLVDCPLPDASVDVFVALNVLEHIADDAGAVASMYRALKPGGVAVIELPAGPWLYDVHDRVLMHERRYTLGGARRLFERAGFTVDRATHLGFLVFPAFVAAKLRGKRHLRKSEREQREAARAAIRGSRSSRLLDVAMRAENALSRWTSFPVGVRCVLTAVKPRSRP